jgi:hypothetical protein
LGNALWLSSFRPYHRECFLYRNRSSLISISCARRGFFNLMILKVFFGREIKLVKNWPKMS